MFDAILSLSDIKNEPFVIDHILWDMEPKQLMEPRLTRDVIKGYILYIDTMDKKPTLFLMRHTSADYAETLARIDEIPQELLDEAVQENQDRQYFGMYPINKKVESWLKKEFGLKS